MAVEGLVGDDEMSVDDDVSLKILYVLVLCVLPCPSLLKINLREIVELWFNWKILP